MFEDVVSGFVGAGGVGAPAGATARPAGPVDVVFARLAWVVVTQFTQLAARAEVGGCVLAPVGSVQFATTLDRAAPSPALAHLLDVLDPGDLHDAALIEAVAGWDRIASWAVARQGQLIRELTARRAITRTQDFTSDEIAARLGCTRTLAENKIGLATALGDLPNLDAALTCGDIDPRKADALTTTLAHLPLDTITQICDTALPGAGELTVPALKARLRALELAHNPDATRQRTTRARRDRHVRLTPTTDAMAWLTALLPADDAATIFTALDAIAATTDPTDPRSYDERRADALTDLATTVLDTGLTPTALRPTPTRATDPTPTRNDTTHDHDAHGDTTDSDAADGDAADGDAAGGDGTGGDGRAPSGASTGDGAARGSGRGGRALRLEHRRRPHLQITIAATTLLGLDNAPGDLAGYGPIPADLARRIALDATWRALYTDPDTGEVTRLGTRTYPPGTVYQPAPRHPDGHNDDTGPDGPDDPERPGTGRGPDPARGPVPARGSPHRPDPRPRPDLHVPRLPPTRLAMRPRPHHPRQPEPPRPQPDHRPLPALPVPTPPPPQDPRRLDRHPRPHHRPHHHRPPPPATPTSAPAPAPATSPTPTPTPTRGAEPLPGQAPSSTRPSHP